LRLRRFFALNPSDSKSEKGYFLKRQCIGSMKEMIIL